MTTVKRKKRRLRKEIRDFLDNLLSIGIFTIFLYLFIVAFLAWFKFIEL